MTGTLYGVGLGPGDPDLVTVKASRLIGSVDVIAYHSARHGRSIARTVAEPWLRVSLGGDAQVEEQLIYPVTTEATEHRGGYQGAMDEFYAECAERLAAHLDAGRDVAVLAEGDPFFYGSYMHMHKRLAHRYPWQVVPGVTSVSGAAAALGVPLVERDEVLTVLPGTLPAEELSRRLAGTDAAVVMKLGRTFSAVREGFSGAGKLDDAFYVERATWPGERTARLADVDPAGVPYFSLAMLPSPLTVGAGPVPAPAAPLEAEPATGGEVVVLGLGPAGRQWLTPQVQEELAAATDLVGYVTYLDRVPPNPRQRRHASDNTVESERAAFALDMARRGRRVAVVSSGDPGVFAMASAVLEVACEAEYADVPVRVLPGLTAAHAVAARAGAPLGHDYAVISLSDRLKPWAVIETRLRAVAAADLVLAVYNPASRSRTWQVGAMVELLREHRCADTVVVVGRDVGGPAEAVRVVTLGTLDPATVDMRCLLIVGSSATVAAPRPGGDTVYTPRRHPS